MTRQHRRENSRAAILLSVVCLAVVHLAGCQREARRSFEGVAEAEVVRLAAPVAGNLTRLDVARGARVVAGSQLFSLVDPAEESARESAVSRMRQIEKTGGGESTVQVGELEKLKAQIAQSDWRLEMKSAQAPVSGVVIETLYRRGDWVPAGAAVVTLLPVDKIRVRFEVPLSVASGLQSGHRVRVTCAGCESPLTGSVTHVSSFATPASFSSDSTALRYVVEARPDPGQSAVLEPGRAVTIHL